MTFSAQCLVCLARKVGSSCDVEVYQESGNWASDLLGFYWLHDLERGTYTIHKNGDKSTHIHGWLWRFYEPSNFPGHSHLPGNVSWVSEWIINFRKLIQRREFYMMLWGWFLSFNPCLQVSAPLKTLTLGPDTFGVTLFVLWKEPQTRLLASH